jgi:predicted amidohydrolase YtcJ
MTRLTQGGYALDESEKISIAEALRIQTMGSAFAGFQDKEIGSIEKGKLADMVIWDRDFYSLAPEEVKEVKAEVTMVNGKIVYKSDKTRLFYQG